ncbi:hypothetical protein BC830DRAFT_657722 [Chytriomyces sp. MP71]|nr:hypothetical protein BC830DRAFT_657722 [Chytriomyces sp. MP71]
MSSTRGSICPLLVPELLSLIITELQTTRLSRTANMATVLELSRVSKALSERVLPLLYKSPPFALRHMDVVQSLLANPSPYLPYLSFIRYLDMAPLARPPMNDPSPAAAWIANTKLAHQLVASCPFLLTVRMDGFPPDVTGTLFANMLLSIPVSVEHIFWDRVAVSDGHLAKMVGRWPNLKTLQIGIVTPFMWGVRNMVAGPPPSQPFQILTLNGIGGAAAASNYGGPDWASPGNSIGLLTLVATSTHLQHMIIQPLPGLDNIFQEIVKRTDNQETTVPPISFKSFPTVHHCPYARSLLEGVGIWLPRNSALCGSGGTSCCFWPGHASTAFLLRTRTRAVIDSVLRYGASAMNFWNAFQ